MEPHFVTDCDDAFRSNDSLLDVPAIFSTSYVDGCIFYLPVNGSRGGDAFFVNDADTVIIALLADMMGHGEEGRAQLQPYLQPLKEMTKRAARQQSLDSIVGDIHVLDRQVGYQHPIALTLISISENEVLQYINEGENSIFSNKNGRVYDLSGKVRHGKVG